MSEDLRNRSCLPCEGGTQPLETAKIQALLKKLNPRWSVVEGKTLSAAFEFENYYRTTAFVNAVAWIAHQEDHHPDISFGYRLARIDYSTHAIGGLSDNDFICAAKIDALLD